MRTRLHSFIIFLNIILSITSGITHATTSDTPPVPAESPEWLIIDGVRHVSYNMVLYLINNNIACTIVVRPADLHFAELRLPKSPLISLVIADYTQLQRPAILETVGKGHKYLFMDPEDEHSIGDQGMIAKLELIGFMFFAYISETYTKHCQNAGVCGVLGECLLLLFLILYFR